MFQKPCTDKAFLVGSDKSLDKLIKDLESHGLKIKVELNMKDCLGCEIVVDKEKKKTWLGQPHIVKKMLS
jgi:NAD(P)H-flavin reductase